MTRRKNSALIICNGESPSRALLRRLAQESDYIVAADGGANIAQRHGIHPDAIVGDLDSITPSARRRLSSSLLLHITRQDNTDLEKCLDVVVARGFARVTLVAATGGRLDFTLGNLSVIWNYVSSLDIELAGDGWRAMPVGRESTIEAPVGTTVSLIPFGNCHGITLRGLQYPLRNASMKIGEVGVSNVVVASRCSVRVRKGNILLLVMHHRRSSVRVRRSGRQRP